MRLAQSALRGAALALGLCLNAPALAQQVDFGQFTGGPQLLEEPLGTLGPWRVALFRNDADGAVVACSAASRGGADPSNGEIGPPVVLLTIWTKAPETPELMLSYDRSRTASAPRGVALEVEGVRWPFFSNGPTDAWWPVAEDLEPFMTAFAEAGQVEIYASNHEGVWWPAAPVDVTQARSALAMARKACLRAGQGAQ